MSEEPKSFDSVIDMLTHDCHKYALENARLKAEVERLEKQVNNLITSLQKSHDEHAKALYKLKYKK